jgi:hypothetical protein
VRLVPVNDLRPGQVLARPARSGSGELLLPAGSVLQAAQIEGLRSRALAELAVCEAGEALPPPAAPAYMDRYGPDFPLRLQAAFGNSLVNRSMQALFLAALGHAADCYRRYRLDVPGEEAP